MLQYVLPFSSDSLSKQICNNARPVITNTTDYCTLLRIIRLVRWYPQLIHFILVSGKWLSSTPFILDMAWPLLTVKCNLIYTIWPYGPIWFSISGSTLAEVMPCCLMAPQLYRNQCRFNISEIQCKSPEGNSTRSTSTFSHENKL